MVYCEKTDSAFPKKIDTTGVEVEGLTKREYFAAAALQGLLPSEFGKQLHIECTKQFNGDPQKTVDYISATALMFADALIAALNEEKK
jgi:hypothetical protein